METSNRLSRPDRLEIFGNDWDDPDDPDDHMETRIKLPIQICKRDTRGSQPSA